MGILGVLLPTAQSCCEHTDIEEGAVGSGFSLLPQQAEQKPELLFHSSGERLGSSHISDEKHSREEEVELVTVMVFPAHTSHQVRYLGLTKVATLTCQLFLVLHPGTPCLILVYSCLPCF